MAAGASAGLTAQIVNGQAGALAKEVENVFARVKEFNTFLAATDLKIAPFSMSSADETAIKSAFATAVELTLVYEGRSTVGTANQAATFMRQLVGLGAHL